MHQSSKLFFISSPLPCRNAIIALSQKELVCLIQKSSLNPDCQMAVLLFLHPLLSNASCIAATAQYKPAIPPTIIIVMQQLSVQSYSPLTSLNQSPHTKPYKNLCPGRDQTAEYQSVPGAVFKKPGLCLNRAALFKRQLRGINRVNA